MHLRVVTDRQRQLRTDAEMRLAELHRRRRSGRQKLTAGLLLIAAAFIVFACWAIDGGLR